MPFPEQISATAPGHETAVLIVDDDDIAATVLAKQIEHAGLGPVDTCGQPRQALKLIRHHDYDLILLDLLMPEMNGDEVLASIREQDEQLPVVMLTAAQDAENAVHCMRLGATNYLVKPIRSEQIIAVAEQILSLRQLERENNRLRRSFADHGIKRPELFSEIVTADEGMHFIFQYIEAIAESDEAVVITGETGTGKELIARALHRAGRHKGPFVAVNTGGLDDTAFDSTLFGHHKGAFTGAIADRAGFVEQARGGTLFLDEIGDLSEACQIKLLRLLQEGEFYPLGSDICQHIDCRIVVATHRSISDEERFRRDLYYRLQTHHVHLPALRERRRDIAILLEHFVTQSAQRLGMRVPFIPPEIYTLLPAYHFPGNVRELESMVHDAVSRAKQGRLSIMPFRSRIQPGTATEDSDAFPVPGRESFRRWHTLPTLKQVQSLLIEEALRRCQNNQSQASHLLGITRQALNQRLNRR